VGARSVPLIASVVLHASIAVGLVASSAGHARAGATSEVAQSAVDVETLDTIEAPPVPVVPVAPPPPVAQASKDVPLPAHTHAYPVDPSHDARPHDPSLHHDGAPADHAHAHDHDHEAAQAAPAIVANAPPEGAALPKFTLSSGSGAPMGAHVATSATGTGAGAVPGSTTSDDVVHTAAAVHVAARLVQSVAAAYPVHARADEVEGDVGVEIVVDREGRVVDARVVRLAGHGFDEAALVAVRAYRFSPAQREGHAVRVRMPWSVQFRLR
jgi:TonB family protein